MTVERRYQFFDADQIPVPVRVDTFTEAALASQRREYERQRDELLEAVVAARRVAVDAELADIAEMETVMAGPITGTPTL